MIALQITETKAFMSRLLASDAFDEFLLQEAVLQMGIGYVIDGHINKDFYQEEELAALSEQAGFIPYKEVRNTLFSLIKGKRTPLAFQVILQLSPKDSAVLFPQGLKSQLIKALLVHIRFDNGKVFITSGISYESFSLDKSPEHIWDEALKKWLYKTGIAFEQL